MYFAAAYRTDLDIYKVTNDSEDEPGRGVRDPVAGSDENTVPGAERQFRIDGDDVKKGVD